MTIYARVEILSAALRRSAGYRKLLLVERNEHDRDSELLRHEASLFRRTPKEVRDKVERDDIDSCILKYLHRQSRVEATGEQHKRPWHSSFILEWKSD